MTMMKTSSLSRLALAVLLLQEISAFAPPKVTRQPFALFMTSSPVAAPSVTKDDRDTLFDLYNTQVTREFEASQLYLAASIWFDREEMVGMAAYMREESNDERDHALSFVDFAAKRNIPLQLQDIEAPEDEQWETALDVWNSALQCEEQNTQSLLNLADAAQTCRDHSLMAFLQPFHMEQVNSEDKLQTIVAKVLDENKTPGLLRQLDSELGSESRSHG